ncbi:Uncharacterized protein RNJ44_05079 [Nakaseomyces bracarensis]|uniref:2-hydroxyacyl-CoA lyase n=1 Tax=Nakaseomyces bracarensis TaxID=273131 RepID=A0ABR4NWW7_9SACH
MSDNIQHSRNIALLLKHQYDVQVVFGIVGIPVVEFAQELQEVGIRFIAFRNEQAASYAASAYGYLTGKPGVLLVVGGPGVIHALAGVYNSVNNRWPLLLIAGSVPTDEVHKGGFQEMDQLSAMKPFTKFAGQLTGTKRDASILFQAWNSAIQGTPGVSYIDFPGDLITQRVKRIDFHTHPIERLAPGPNPSSVAEISSLIKDHKEKNILVVIGKGSTDAYSQLRHFVEKFNFPFLPTPMAKGVIPDSHQLNVSSARSLALKNADLVLVFGARLNWILHYAEPPKWNPNAIFVQIDHDPETLGINNPQGNKYCLWGDIQLTVEALTESLLNLGFDRSIGISKPLAEKIKANKHSLGVKLNPENYNGNLPLNYYSVYSKLKHLIDDKSTIIVSEGANTMDIARISFETDHPKRRLDAGTNATMGVGLGYAIASKLCHPDMNVVTIQGDSAFGFSGMEIESAVRSKLGIIFVVMNNSGIYHGTENPDSLEDNKLPPTMLTQECRYDIVANGLGGKGYLVKDLPSLERAFRDALNVTQSERVPCLLNVIIEPGKQKKISFGWQNKAKL